jgi:acyl-CoA thioesterase
MNMDLIRDLFARDRYAAHSGIELVSVAPGQATARMVIQPCHLNGFGTVQGGAIFTLADFAFAAASNAQGQAAVAINVSISFMTAARTGTLTANARELSKNSKTGAYTVDIVDDQGRMVAVFQGLVFRKRETVEEMMALVTQAAQQQQ